MSKKRDQRIKDEIAVLAACQDADIDTSNIPEVTDWSEAIRGKFEPRKNKDVIVHRHDSDSKRATGALARKNVEPYTFDSDYLRRMKRRDPATEAHFVSYFGPRLDAKLRKRGFAPDKAEDVRQETLFRSLTAVQRGAVRHPERLAAYVNAVCESMFLEQGQGHSPLVSASEPMYDGAAVLEALVLDRERQKIIATIVEKLPVKHRALLRALLLEGLSENEMRARFGVKPGYLRLILFQARKKFIQLARIVSAKSAFKSD